MASFVFTPSTIEIWGRFFRRKFGQKEEEPLKLQKHKVIAQAFAKRKEFKNHGKISISFHNSHTDPVGLKFDMNSAVGSHDFSSTWANNLPHFVNRRYALTGCASSSSHRRNSIDSEVSISFRHVSVESRRNSNDSQVSVKIAEMKTKVASRSRGSKSKSRSSRHQKRDFTSRRYSRKESSTSMESQIVTQKGSHSTATTAEMGIPFLVGAKRRSGIATLDRFQINEYIANNKYLLPSTTSEDEKSSLEILMQNIGITEHQVINTDYQIDDSDILEMKRSNHFELSDVSSKDNVASAGRNSKNSNRSVNSKKSLNMGNGSRLRKTRKSSRSIAKAASIFPVTNGSGRIKIDKKSEQDKKSKDPFNLIGMELVPMNMNLQGSYSGRSDVGIQTEIPSEHFSSTEYVEKMMKQEEDEDDEDLMESHKLLPKRVQMSTSAKRRDTNENPLTESEKLKLLLLPSK